MELDEQGSPSPSQERTGTARAGAASPSSQEDSAESRPATPRLRKRVNPPPWGFAVPPSMDIPTAPVSPIVSYLATRPRQATTPLTGNAVQRRAQALDTQQGTTGRPGSGSGHHRPGSSIPSPGPSRRAGPSGTTTVLSHPSHTAAVADSSTGAPASGSVPERPSIPATDGENEEALRFLHHNLARDYSIVNDDGAEESVITVSYAFNVAA
jgi:hypothetical protein